jgi:hypothetical protein
MLRTLHRSTLLLALSLSLGACGGADASTDPTAVTLGDTTFVVVMNPPINDANAFGLTPPGPTQRGVSVIDFDTGLGGPTGADGVVVIALADGGNRRLDLRGGDITSSTQQPIERQDLVEIAFAATEGDVQVMRRITYPFEREVVELTPDMGIAAVNDALATSDRIVLLGGGTYEGDLVFAGSRVALFGAGPDGGEVRIVGSVTVSGSENRVRGAHVTGDVMLTGSEVGLSFTRVDGTTTVSGSSVSLLVNRFCGAVDVSGSGAVALGNHGLAPLAPEGC